MHKCNCKNLENEIKYLKDCCIQAGKELEKHSFAWDGKEKNLIVQAMELNEMYEKLKEENQKLKEENQKLKDELNTYGTTVICEICTEKSNMKNDNLLKTIKSIKDYFNVLENIIPPQILSEGNQVFKLISDAKKEIDEVIKNENQQDTEESNL